MSISQIQGDGGINPLKDSHVEKLAKQQKKVKGEDKEVNRGRDRVEISERAQIFQEVNKYKKELENIPSPNDARLGEIKESIKNGELLSDEVINATAERLSDLLQ